MVKIWTSIVLLFFDILLTKQLPTTIFICSTTKSIWSWQKAKKCYNLHFYLIPLISHSFNKSVYYKKCLHHPIYIIEDLSCWIRVSRHTATAYSLPGQNNISRVVEIGTTFRAESVKKKSIVHNLRTFQNHQLVVWQLRNLWWYVVAGHSMV